MLLGKQNEAPMTHPKEMEIYVLLDRELKVIILKKLSELWGNTDSQLNKVRKITYEHNDKLDKAIETIQ